MAAVRERAELCVGIVCFDECGAVRRVRVECAVARVARECVIVHSFSFGVTDEFCGDECCARGPFAVVAVVVFVVLSAYDACRFLFFLLVVVDVEWFVVVRVVCFFRVELYEALRARGAVAFFVRPRFLWGALFPVAVFAPVTILSGIECSIVARIANDVRAVPALACSEACLLGIVVVACECGNDLFDDYSSACYFLPFSGDLADVVVEAVVELGVVHDLARSCWLDECFVVCSHYFSSRDFLLDVLWCLSAAVELSSVVNDAPVFYDGVEDVFLLWCVLSGITDIV